MSAQLTVDTTNFNAALKRLALESKRDYAETFRRSCGSFVRRVMGITPPAKGARGIGGTLTKEDQYRGQNAIARDLRALFIGHKLKGKRRERYPDLRAIHKQAFQFKRPGVPLKPSLPGNQRYDVDGRKLVTLTRELFARVGSMASGWLAGALATGARGVPAWVARFGPAAGSATPVKTVGSEFSFTVANNSVPGVVLEELNKRVGYALDYETKAMLIDLDKQTAANADKWNRENGVAA